MEMFMLDLEKIKKRREKLGISFQELSRRTKVIDIKGVGISGVTCGRIENGTSSPVTDSLLLILPVLSLLPGECFIPAEAQEGVVSVNKCDSCCYNIKDCTASGIVFDDSQGSNIIECDKYEEF